VTKIKNFFPRYQCFYKNSKIKNSQIENSQKYRRLLNQVHIKNTHFQTQKHQICGRQKAFL
jgi:hypothetical protein